MQRHTTGYNVKNICLCLASIKTRSTTLFAPAQNEEKAKILQTLAKPSILRIANNREKIKIEISDSGCTHTCARAVCESVQ